VSELARNTAAIAEKVDIDPEELAAAENRLTELFKLKRRYAPDIGMILDIRRKAAEKLDTGKNAEAKLAQFERDEKVLQDSLEKACSTLSEKRRKNAKMFTSAVAEKLQAVGFFKSEIHADFSSTTPSAEGADKLELLFSANPGEAPAPLRKIASSGELSRLMLALKTVLTDSDEIPTVVFDEIDMNIGGETANKVGEELKALGRKHQILCISHLAQVAAKADTHFHVQKEVIDGRTVSKTVLLKSPEQELARMLGGGSAALEHAKTLIAGK
jgi:DNA repair protein RecN (Recombination protein N)